MNKFIKNKNLSVKKKKEIKNKYSLHWQPPKCNTRYKFIEVCTRHV